LGGIALTGLLHQLTWGKISVNDCSMANDGAIANSNPRLDPDGRTYPDVLSDHGLSPGVSSATSFKFIRIENTIVAAQDHDVLRKNCVITDLHPSLSVDKGTFPDGNIVADSQTLRVDDGHARVDRYGNTAGLKSVL
jgi:hypothetical protein